MNLQFRSFIRNNLFFSSNNSKKTKMLKCLFDTWPSWREHDKIIIIIKWTLFITKGKKTGNTPGLKPWLASEWWDIGRKSGKLPQRLLGLPINFNFVMLFLFLCFFPGYQFVMITGLNQNEHKPISYVWFQQPSIYVMLAKFHTMNNNCASSENFMDVSERKDLFVVWCWLSSSCQNETSFTIDNCK